MIYIDAELFHIAVQALMIFSTFTVAETMLGINAEVEHPFISGLVTAAGITALCYTVAFIGAAVVMFLSTHVQLV